MNKEGNTQFDFSRLSFADLDVIKRHCEHFCQVAFTFSDDPHDFEGHAKAAEFYEFLYDASIEEIDSRIKQKFGFEGFIKKTEPVPEDEKYIDYMASKL